MTVETPTEAWILKAAAPASRLAIRLSRGP